MNDLTDIEAIIAPRKLGMVATFAQPWEARTFALTLALVEQKLFTLQDFQQALIARIAIHEASTCIVGTEDYYTKWIEALEHLLESKGLLKAKRLSDLEKEIVSEAASRKDHQHSMARDEAGQLKILPITVDAGRPI